MCVGPGIDVPYTDAQAKRSKSITRVNDNIIYLDPLVAQHLQPQQHLLYSNLFSPTKERGYYIVYNLSRDIHTD